jgi:hypothetical protein
MPPSASHAVSTVRATAASSVTSQANGRACSGQPNAAAGPSSRSARVGDATAAVVTEGPTNGGAAWLPSRQASCLDSLVTF